jgi:hypothetical protein
MQHNLGCVCETYSSSKLKKSFKLHTRFISKHNLNDFFNLLLEYVSHTHPRLCCMHAVVKCINILGETLIFDRIFFFFLLIHSGAPNLSGPAAFDRSVIVHCKIEVTFFFPIGVDTSSGHCLNSILSSIFLYRTFCCMHCR